MKIEHVTPEKLVPADYNPRMITDKALDSICRSIVEFGIVDPLVVRREDNLIIGGHQRFKAILRLLAGQYVVKGKAVPFELPNGKIPVVYIEGLNEEKTKLLNLALNKATGEWDHERVAGLFEDMRSINIDELTLSGFSPAEITDYIDLSSELRDSVDEEGASGSGSIPPPTQKAPSISLDFSSKDLRDAVKTHIGSNAKPGEPSGDALARMLEVKAPRAKKATKLKRAG